MEKEEIITEECWNEIKRKIQIEASIADIAYNLWIADLELKDICKLQDVNVRFLSNNNVQFLSSGRIAVSV